MRIIHSRLAAALLPLVLVPGAAAQRPQLDVPYVPTPHEVVSAMLEVARVDSTDLVYDLGSGDGRIVVAAARDHGARGVGIDLNPERVEDAWRNARRARVLERVEFQQGDLFEMDFSDATVVTLYLLTDVNRRLRPRLLGQLRPGTRVVSHAFDMGDWTPDSLLMVPHGAGQARVYYWVIPAQVEGDWELRVGGDEQMHLRLRQRFQRIDGEIVGGPGAAAVLEPMLAADRISFGVVRRAGGDEVRYRLSGTIDGDTMSGVDEVSGERWTARRTGG